MKNHPRTVAVVSLGCAKNLVDAEVMCGTLATHGYALTDSQDDADILLVNTCSFIADARAESEGEIANAVAWKRSRPGRVLVVTGCLPQRSLADLRRRLPEVDVFAGLDDVARIAELVGAVEAGPGATPTATAADGFAAPRYLYDEKTPRLLLTPHSFAYIKIAEGCDHHCRFCAIPRIRGRQRSRTVASVVAECRQLLDMGVRELNFIAQDTTRYGADLKDGTSLAQLLAACDALPGTFWLRLLYTHPRHFAPELFPLFRDARHLVPYIDMPLQHIADGVLKGMGRGLGESETRTLMERIRRDLPQATVRTTFLVGYPGETAADFEALVEYVKSYRFDRLGVFAYSPEEGTPAAQLTEGLVPRAEAERRRDVLMRLQHEISLKRNRQLVGQTLEVLVERVASRHQLVARSRGDAPDVDNVVHVKSAPALAERGFLSVRITRADAYDLHAVPV